MRSFLVSAALAAALLLSSGTLFARGRACAAPARWDPTCGAEPTCAADSASPAGLGSECDRCARGCGRRWHGLSRGARFEGLEPCFNCGCNGSYKFPVPPLSTYHWPGMYSAQLMTDYQSPWRFPPLKPYADEFPAVELGAAVSAGIVRTVSATSTIETSATMPMTSETRRAGEMEPMSSKLLRGR